jgi:hypothetical protein
MEIEIDDQLEDELLERIKRKYKLFSRKREGLHQSDLIYCITKKYWMDKFDMQVTNDESLFFAIGLGLEQVLLENGDEQNRPGVIELDGILMSPDYSLVFDGNLAELKSSRISLPAGAITPTKDWPSSWIKQMKAYTYAKKRGAFPDNIKRDNEYRLIVFLVIPAKIASRKFTFTDEELDKHWAWMLNRKDALEEAQRQDLPPEPYFYVESQSKDDWECQRCPAQMMCSVYYSDGKFIKGTEHG